MVKRMLIDATHPEETRVVIVNGTRLEEFDVETSTKKQIKGNIYLAKVIRVEPSLQAAFVDYGGARHGFLAFGEIHPDYYQIPVADRERLLAEVKAAAQAEDAHDEEHESVDEVGGDEAEEEAPARRSRTSPAREYKIQEVIKRRQILLVQVVKEERGNKGAALTTYMSLAGRYCVLMPNTARGGGVSRKITNVADRKRLKSLLSDLEIPSTMALILRTAGAERSKTEIKRDHDYLMRTWDTIRETTLVSQAPALIHEEGNLIKRSIRDLYAADIEEIIVEGDEGYRMAKDFIKQLIPSHAKKVQPYKDEGMPLLHRYQVESQLDAMHSPEVTLRSGGYIVLNQTEALVAIDVNSGRATKERHIEETALKTNLEAAEEVARQLRLRDLAGLIVIDFIDMEESKNNAAVERRLKEALRFDRARIQVGRISHFGLLELSRQRLRPSLMETSFQTCAHCGGAGVVRSVESTAVHMLRVIEEEGVRRRSSEVRITVPTNVALYILNHKRQALADIEARYVYKVIILGDEDLIPPNYTMERIKTGGDEIIEAEPREAPVALPAPPTPPTSSSFTTEEGGEEEGGPRRRRRRRGRGRGRNGEEGEVRSSGGFEPHEDAEPSEESPKEAESEDSPRHLDEGRDTIGEDGERRPRRRGRRGGRRRRRHGEEGRVEEGHGHEEQGGESSETVSADAPAAPVADDKPARAPRRRKLAEPVAETAAVADTVTDEAPKAKRPSRRTKPVEAESVSEAPAEDKPKRARAPRGAKKVEAVEAEAAPSAVKAPRKKAAPAPAKDAEAAPKAKGIPIPEGVKVVEVGSEPAADKPAKKGWWSK